MWARIHSWFRVGALAPSSHVLAERMAQAVPFDARVIIELGAGTGSITRALLKHVRYDAVIIAVEELPVRVEELRTIKDSRLVIVCGNAMSISAILSQCGFDHADCVVSGLPLSTLPRQEEHVILAATLAVLSPGGVFVQFQYFLSSFAAIYHYFPYLSVVSWVLWNLPPAFVYRAIK